MSKGEDWNAAFKIEKQRPSIGADPIKAILSFKLSTSRFRHFQIFLIVQIFILIFYSNILIDELWKQEENQGFAIVKLRHPRSAQSNLFAFSHRDKNVFEVNQLEDGKRWVRDTFF